MKIIVKENHFKKIMGVDDIPAENLIEQITASANPANKTFVLQQKINDVLNDPKRLISILNNTTIQVKIVGNDEYQLILGNKAYSMRRTQRGMHVLTIPPGKHIAGGRVPMSVIMPEIEKIPEYKEMAGTNPKIKAAVEAAKVTAELHAGETSENSYFFFEVKSGDSSTLTRKDKKGAVPFGKKYPLGEFFNRQPLIFRFPKPYDNSYGYLSIVDVESDVSTITLQPDITPNSGPKTKETYIAPERFTFRGLGDVFNFGDVTFKNEERVNQELHGYKKKKKRFHERFGESFIEYVKSQNPTVLGFASRDGDPKEEIQGKYQPCSGFKTRAEYDVCLSTERAKLIADILNKGLPEFDGVFKYKGVGETTKWGPGWTPENANTITPVDTAPNRRYLLSGFKKAYYPTQSN